MIVTRGGERYVTIFLIILLIDLLNNVSSIPKYHDFCSQSFQYRSIFLYSSPSMCTFTKFPCAYIKERICLVCVVSVCYECTFSWTLYAKKKCSFYFFFLSSYVWGGLSRQNWRKLWRALIHYFLKGRCP